jgi:hypothetical protein
VGHATHLLRTRDTSVTNGDGRLSDNKMIKYISRICKHKINLVRISLWV